MMNEKGFAVGTRVTSENHPENKAERVAATAFDHEHLQEYLSRLLDLPVQVKSISPLRGIGSNKTSSPRHALRIDYDVGGIPSRAVLEMETFDPELKAGLEVHASAGKTLSPIPRHARVLGASGMESGGSLVPLSGMKNRLFLTEFVEGRAYGEDLVRLKLGGFSIDRDRHRADALAEHLAEIHNRRGHEPKVYVDRIRELLGHAGGILGMIDGFPPQEGLLIPELLEHLEHRSLKWRWRLKGRTHRLRRIHGDFHPWNILFRDGTDFTVLDRSPIQWGEPADDVACLTMPYLFFALQSQGESRKMLIELFGQFWSTYVEKSGDSDILDVAAPFLVRHALSLASPVWYPDLNLKVRRCLFSFMFRVLEASRFDPNRVEELLRED